MAEFSSSIVLPCSLAAVRAFLGTPANLPRVSDPELELEIISAPEVVTVNERIEFRVTSFGFKHRSIHVYTHISDTEIFEEQIEGPMRSWQHRQNYELVETGKMKLIDTFTFEPPGGMLGFLLTEERLRESLEQGMEARHSALSDMVEAGELV